MILHGRNIIIEADGTTIASSRSCEIHITADTDEVSSPGNGDWHQYYTMRKGWTISMGYLVTALKGAIEEGKTYTITIQNRDDEDDKRFGNAICTENVITATIGNLCQGSFRFLGTGPLF
jgi:hypothetical protein